MSEEQSPLISANGVHRNGSTVRHELSFLRKAQIVAGFEMDVKPGTAVSSEYNGNFLFVNAVGTTSKDKVAAFLREEGLELIIEESRSGGVARIKLAADDYHRLEERYTIPLKPEDARHVLRQFHEPAYSASFDNHNAAFGSSFSRVAKLLRNHGISFTCQTADRKCFQGEMLNEGTITLSPESYARLQEAMPNILAAEAKRYASHQDRATGLGGGGAHVA